MIEQKQSVVNTQRTMDNFLKQLEQNIQQNVYPSKEDILREITDFKTFMENLPKTEEVELQNFDKQILMLLQKYDEKSIQIPKENNNTYKQFEKQNGQSDATIKIDGQNHTIKQIQGSEKDVWGEMQDMYNQKAIKNMQNSADIPQDTVEQNFERLRKYTHEEVQMGAIAPAIKIFSVSTKALQYYSTKHHIKLDFSNENLARDQEGNMYEAVIHATGEITIYKTQTTTVVAGERQTVSKVELETMTMNELVTFEKTKPVDNQTINFGFLEYLKMHIEENAYREILKSAKLSQPEIDMYEDLLKEEKEHKRQREQMMQKTKESHQKVLVVDNKKRNGFVDALLLSIITSLFGGLCLAYFLIGIL